MNPLRPRDQAVGAALPVGKTRPSRAGDTGLMLPPMQQPPAAFHGSGSPAPSLLVRGAGGIRLGTLRGWHALPPGAFVRWILVVLVGAVASFGFTAFLTLSARQIVPARGWEQWDHDVISAVETQWPISFTDAIILESPGNIFIMLPLTLVAAGMCLWFGRVLLAGSILACYGVARGLILFGWSLWDRARPDLVSGGVAALKAHSFPSGHTLLICTTYGLLAWLWIRSTRSWLERGLAVVLLAGLIFVVGAARVRLGAHWPTDTLAGAVIGLFWLGWNIAALELAGRARRRSAT